MWRSPRRRRARSPSGRPTPPTGRVLWGPCPRAVDVALERAAEHLLQPARDVHEGTEVDAGLDPLSLEQVDEILGRHVAGRARREGTAAEAADGCVEHMCPGLERGEAVRVAG